MKMMPTRVRMMPSFCVPGIVWEIINNPPMMKRIPMVLTNSNWWGVCFGMFRIVGGIFFFGVGCSFGVGFFDWFGVMDFSVVIR